MILRTSKNSPFGRKVRVAATVLGLSDRMQRVDANFLDPADPLRTANPLGKMPALELPDGETLYDSAVILEYLDHLAGGGRLIPAAGPARWRTLRDQALADGIMDAGALIVMERNMRPEERRHQEWMDFQRGKMERGLARLAAMLAGPVAIDAGTIAVGCMLGWVDFRRQVDWRSGHPGLVAWFDEFRARLPFFDETQPG